MGDVAKKVGVVTKNWELSYLELSLFGVVAKKVGVVALELSLWSCRSWSCLFWSCRRSLRMSYLT